MCLMVFFFFPLLIASMMLNRLDRSVETGKKKKKKTKNIRKNILQKYVLERYCGGGGAGVWSVSPREVFTSKSILSLSTAVNLIYKNTYTQINVVFPSENITS